MTKPIDIDRYHISLPLLLLLHSSNSKTRRSYKNELPHLTFLLVLCSVVHAWYAFIIVDPQDLFEEKHMATNSYNYTNTLRKLVGGKTTTKINNNNNRQ